MLLVTVSHSTFSKNTLNEVNKSFLCDNACTFKFLLTYMPLLFYVLNIFDLQ